MRPSNHLVIACVCAIAAWVPLADAQERTRHETRSGVIDVWQRPISDTGMAGADRGNGGKFLIVLEGVRVPENHGADLGMQYGYGVVDISALCR